MRSLPLHLVSFVLTFVLFVLVSSDTLRTETITVDLQVGTVPPGYVLLNELPDVRVTVQGTARAFSRLRATDIRAVPVNVSPDQQRWEVRSSSLGIPSGLQVLSIEPATVDLVVDQIVETEVPVRANIRGRTAPGYEISETVIEPSTIRVRAPSRYFPELDAVFTETIDLEDAAETFSRDVPISFQQPFVVTDPANIQIRVSFRIDAVEDTRILEDVQLIVPGSQASRCSLDFNTIRVTVRGPKTLTDRLDPSQVFASVDCATVFENGTGRFWVTPSVKNVRPLEVVDVSPADVLVTVTAPHESRPPPGDGQLEKELK